MSFRSLYLRLRDPRDWELLKEMAAEQLRSPNDQAAILVGQGLARWQHERELAETLPDLFEMPGMSRTDELEGADYPDQPSHEVILLTMRQTAALCQVSLNRVREWTFAPGFPVIRTPRCVRIHARLLEEWLARWAAEERPAA